MHSESELLYNTQPHFHVINPGLSTSPGAAIGVVGPTRTTRMRRTGSFSSTSPPPSVHFTTRPQAIAIPRSSNRSHNHSGSGGSVGLSMSSLSPTSCTSPISTSTTSTSSMNHGHGGWYNFPGSPDFSLSESLHSSGGGYDTELYLPPSSALQQHHSRSLSKSNHFVSYADGSRNGINDGTRMINGIDGVSGINGIDGLTTFNAAPLPLSLTTPSIGLGSGYGLNGMKTKKNGVNNRSSMTLTGTKPTTSTMTRSETTATKGLLIMQEKQALIANEKRRKRRESHNAVERRRRDNINERISELATLIPECMLQGPGTNPITGSPEDGGYGTLPSSLEAQDMSLSAKKDDFDAGCGGATKANKGIILRKSVEYIRYLQQLVSVQGVHNRQLEAELKTYKTAAGDKGQSHLSSSSPSSSSGFSTCSILASISLSISSPTTNAEEKSKDSTDPISMQQHQHQSQTSHGFGSFESLFRGLPSMPEEEDGSAEYSDADMCSAVDGDERYEDE